MATSRPTDARVLEIMKCLHNCIEDPNIHDQYPAKFMKDLRREMAQMKRFFRAYHQNEDYATPNKIEEKIEFWKQFTYQILVVEIKDKPKGMPDEEFLFDVKFEKYSNIVINDLVWPSSN